MSSSINSSSNNAREQELQHSNGIMSNKKEMELAESLPPVSEIMDTRLPYNIEYVVCNLLRFMVSKRMLSINDAKRIMASGESYLH